LHPPTPNAAVTMSARLVSIVWASPTPHDAAARLLLLALADMAADDGYCTATLEQLRQRLGLRSVRGVQRVIDRLCANTGSVSLLRHPAPGHATTYQVVVDNCAGNVDNMATPERWFRGEPQFRGVNRYTPEPQFMGTPSFTPLNQRSGVRPEAHINTKNADSGAENAVPPPRTSVRMNQRPPDNPPPHTPPSNGIIYNNNNNARARTRTPAPPHEHLRVVVVDGRRVGNARRIGDGGAGDGGDGCATPHPRLAPAGTPPTSLTEQLVQRGISKRTAERLATTHPPNVITAQVDAFDDASASGKARSPGWLVRAIEQQWASPAAPERLYTRAEALALWEQNGGGPRRPLTTMFAVVPQHNAPPLFQRITVSASLLL
jgi:hypothetical protein